MYARIAVTADALTGSSLPDSIMNSMHRGLLEAINAHGRLVFSSPAEALDMIRLAGSTGGLPQDARKLWEVTLLRLRRHHRVTILDGTATPIPTALTLAELRATWGMAADVAVVADSTGARLGISPTAGMASDPTAAPDVAVLPSATNCPRWQRHRDLTARAIAATGSSREDFWSEVLEPLATDARNVTVLDRYLFATIWKRQTSPRPDLEHVTWLLQRLDSVMAADGQVQLFSDELSKSSSFTAAQTAKQVHDLWTPPATGRIGKVTLKLAKSTPTDPFPHDRHIRFSTGAAIGVEAGFDRLRDTTVGDPDGMKWSYHWETEILNTLQKREDRASALSSAQHEATVLQR
ncbi:hypothetical protein ACFYO7_06395 [Nocardia salmonicida]|uniref:hypothetical protein n=1 Tax=Nocardia salmonicida TaxID=53431 RepID=UPI0036B76AFA